MVSVGFAYREDLEGYEGLSVGKGSEGCELKNARSSPNFTCDGI